MKVGEKMNKKVPKYILEALEKRQKYAELFMKYDGIITNYCINNSIESESINGSYLCITEPDTFKESTFKDIQEQLNNGTKPLKFIPLKGIDLGNE